MSKKVKSYAPDPISAPAEESMMSGGRMLFTGPDYLRDHQVKVEDEHRYIGKFCFRYSFNFKKCFFLTV